jgi:dTDP-4-dehydrorhamnose 3,5-epimerase
MPGARLAFSLVGVFWLIYLLGCQSKLNELAARCEETKKRMDIRELVIPDVKLIVPQRYTDARGYFSETWSDRLFRREIANVTFVQDNLSVTAKKGTLRGLHFQRPPFAQGKLVRVVRGSILDIAVDIRKGSPTYSQHVATTLNAHDGAQLWIPPGFLHGFCTIEDVTEVSYKVTSYYSADHDAGVVWNDPTLGIKWPVDASSVVLSEKDQHLPRFLDLPDLFA